MTVGGWVGREALSSGVLFPSIWRDDIRPPRTTPKTVPTTRRTKVRRMAYHPVFIIYG